MNQHTAGTITAQETRLAQGAAEIREFFRSDPLVAEFVETYQVGIHPWGATLDHAGRLILMPPRRDVVHAIQVAEDGFHAVTFADPLDAFDPEAVIAPKVAGTAWVVGKGETPREAFKALCDRLQFHLESASSPGM